MDSLPEQVRTRLPKFLTENEKKTWAMTSRRQADRVGKMLAIPRMPVHERLAALTLPTNRALFEKEELMAMMDKVHNNALLIRFLSDLPPSGWLVKDLEDLIEKRIATLSYQRNIKQLLLAQYIDYLRERRPFSRILRLLEKIRSREILSRLVVYLHASCIPLPPAVMEDLKARVNVSARNVLGSDEKSESPILNGIR